MSMVFVFRMRIMVASRFDVDDEACNILFTNSKSVTECLAMLSWCSVPLVDGVIQRAQLGNFLKRTDKQIHLLCGKGLRVGPSPCW
jgi:hypothetical protein